MVRTSIESRNNAFTNKHIYITSNEEIKEGVNQWYLDKYLNKPYNSAGAQYSPKQDVIILTTDQDLIKDGVQAIDDNFLEWFVQNPSCEEVEIERGYLGIAGFCKSNEIISEDKVYYKIIIPQEEPKQEALEKAISKLSKSISKLDDAVKELSIERISFSKSINDLNK
jgi:hypothetical protein